MNDEIHIGNLILGKLKENGQTVSWLAQKVYCDRSNLYRIFKRTSIDTDLLMRISNALHYNFFDLFSSCYQSKENNNTVAK
ncbi:MAG: helix-turn-helix transcriptional regulator [Prevotellaceae bacterium]|jgi:hypothetical protein|nr:helix-turn-helix transcriptional regulator [Prevotellaceae bacterium]